MLPLQSNWSTSLDWRQSEWGEYAIEIFGHIRFTVEPLNNGHVGSYSVHYKEVSASEVKNVLTQQENDFLVL